MKVERPSEDVMLLCLRHSRMRNNSLKYSLNRLRNCLSEEHLEPLLMAVKKVVLYDIQNGDFIDNVSIRSVRLQELGTFIILNLLTSFSGLHFIFKTCFIC